MLNVAFGLCKYALRLDKVYQVVVQLFHVVYELAALIELYQVVAKQLSDEGEALLRLHMLPFLKIFLNFLQHKRVNNLVV